VVYIIDHPVGVESVPTDKSVYSQQAEEANDSIDPAPCITTDSMLSRISSTEHIYNERDFMHCTVCCYAKQWK